MLRCVALLLPLLSAACAMPPSTPQSLSSLGVAASQPAPTGAGAPQLAGANATLAMPAESLGGCIQREAVASGHETLLSLATRDRHNQTSLPPRAGQPFAEQRLHIGPDTLTAYARAVLRTAAQTGVATDALNNRLLRRDLACIETQITAARRMLATPQHANRHVDHARLQDFVTLNSRLGRDLQMLYRKAGHYLAHREREDIPERIARGFDAETLTMMDNSGLITQLQAHRTATR